MTALVVAVIAALALLDGAFSGLRASLGRGGLVDHTAEDRRGLRLGAVLISVLAVPAVGATVADVTLTPTPMRTYTDAGLIALTVLGPFAVVVLLALVAYGTLRWELKYVASAMILGPFTLARPFVIGLAVTVVVASTSRAGVAAVAVLAAAASLLVEPILGRRFGKAV